MDELWEDELLADDSKRDDSKRDDGLEDLAVDIKSPAIPLDVNMDLPIIMTLL